MTAADIDGPKLRDWLAEHVPALGDTYQIEKFSGGQSNPTYRIAGAEKAVVLRRKPFGDLLPSAHAVDREFRLIDAVHPTGFPVPRPLALCEDETVIGAVFYVMEMVEGRTFWDGIRNYQVRNFIRDDIKKGDEILFYHSNAKPPGVVGIAEVVKESYPDPTQFDAEDGHYDPKSDPSDPTWLMFDLKAKHALPDFVALNDLKGNKKLSKMLVVQRGQRLSIQPVTPGEWDEVLRMGGL